GKNVLLLLPRVAQGGQRVGGLARLGDEQRKISWFERRAAVAEFRRDIDFNRQFRESLEPVFGDQPRIEGGPACRDRQPLELLPLKRKLLRQSDPLVHHVDVMSKGVADDLRL